MFDRRPIPNPAVTCNDVAVRNKERYILVLFEVISRINKNTEKIISGLIKIGANFTTIQGEAPDIFHK